MSADPSLAALVAIGDELLDGRYPDANSAHIAARLPEVGRRAGRITVVGDDEDILAATLSDLCTRFPLVVTSGGLGPTLDDTTRHACARAAGVELVRSAEALAHVRGWYERAGRPMPDSNERQALVPAGARVLPNPNGTALGFRVAAGGAELVALPGPPHEMQPMVADHLLPWLASRPPTDRVHRSAALHLVGLSESVFADAVGDWMRRDANPLVGVTASDGVLSVRLTAAAQDAEGAAARLAERLAELRARFGAQVFSVDEADPARVLGGRLLAGGVSVTTAESCTGGLVCARLTAVPGISAVLREAFVTYSDRAKAERLGVPRELLERHGAVSREVAEAMARGAAERAGARLALSVTGVAGPGGGSAEKPVGLVWFGRWFDGAIVSEERRFPDTGRERVRRWAATAALALGLRAVPG